MAKKYHFLHLGINFKAGGESPERLEEVEQVLNGARDWFRYTPNCWLIYTSMEPTTWHERLRKINWMPSQSYLICAVDLKRKSGWLPPTAWEWINRERDGG